MKLEQQVCSLELAKKLKELGVKQESLFMWAPSKNGYGMEIRLKRKISFERSEFVYSAYTVAELGEMLPQILKIKKIKYQLFVSVAVDKQWFVVYANEKDYSDNAPIKFMMCHNEADARAKMLVYLYENKLINK